MSFLPWNNNVTTTFSSAATGAFSFDPSLHKIYIKPAVNPSSKSYAVSVKNYGINAESVSDIAINNVLITRFSLHGIQFKNCIRCSVKNSTIVSGGGAVIAINASGSPSYLYAGNGIEFGNSSTNGVVDGVIISQIFDSGITPQTYANAQTLSNMTIQNSTIDQCGFAGLEISVLSHGGSTGSSLSGVNVSGMTITNSGKGWSAKRYGTEGSGIRIKADAGAGSISGIQVQTTTISGSAGDGVKLAGNIGAITLNRMSLSNNNYGINVTEASATSLQLILTASLIFSNLNYGIYYNAPAAAGFRVLHNTFYNNASVNFGILNQSGEAKILNNIFYSSSAMTHLYVASTLSNPVVNNNCYNNVTNMFGYNGAPYSTVNLFKTATGFENSGLGGTVGLNNPATNDFTLQSSSQCRSLGSGSAAITLDFSGFPYAATPSSGAYEFH